MMDSILDMISPTSIIEEVVGNCFDDRDMLKAYDLILPKSDHYRSVLDTHARELDTRNKIIDTGCGTGILAMKLLESYKKVTAVDINATPLSILREKARGSGKLGNLVLLNADMTRLSMLSSTQFDGASSMIAAHLVDRFDAHIEEIFRLLIPGGRFIITARAKGGDQSILVDITRKSLEEQGAYQDYESHFQKLQTSLLMTATKRSKSLLTTEQAMESLLRAGFDGVETLSNQTGGVMYTLVASKP